MDVVNKGLVMETETAATSIDLKLHQCTHLTHPTKVLANDPASQRHQNTDDLEGTTSQVMGLNSCQARIS